MDATEIKFKMEYNALKFYHTEKRQLMINKMSSALGLETYECQPMLRVGDSKATSTDRFLLFVC